MSDSLQSKILDHLKARSYKPMRPNKLAEEMNVSQDAAYGHFRDALRELMHAGRVMLGTGGNVMLPTNNARQDGITGSYRHNKRGFGFVVPTDPESHEDLFIPEGENGGAMTGDVVRARITNTENRDGKMMYRGRITEILSRSQKQFVGSLIKQHNQWVVLPDGNMITEAIFTPDAASKHIREGTKVVVELTTYPKEGQPAQGVITRVLGQAGEKDVDLQSVIVQFNLPAEFPEECLQQAREAVDRFNNNRHYPDRLDLSGTMICTIDPDDAKDYDDAISLERVDGGVELGVHIADVSHFVPPGSPLDVEAKERGNSVYFSGHVIPMLPEILSNGVCSLQADVPRLCKSAFITLDENAQPIRTRFASTIIRSSARLRYREAQAILDGAGEIPHPDGPRKVSDYPPSVVDLLHRMNHLARRIQKRRLAAGQLVLDLPEIELKLDDQGKVVGAEAEDQSFTHTLIEMFMVEANEAVARLLNDQHAPFLRRIHPEPDTQDSTRLRHFVEVSGFKLPKDLDRKALQQLLASVKDKPQAFAINLAVLKSLTRAEYSPKDVGHYALASRQYGHFTSPIRRYADLTIHRLLKRYIEGTAGAGQKRRKVDFSDEPDFGELSELGKHLSFTERRADDAEKELRQVKILKLLAKSVGDEVPGVVTGITNFGVFVQLTTWLVDGLIRYEHLMDDWWDVDEKAGQIRGQRTGKRIGIGDFVTVRIARVVPARRELELAIVRLHREQAAGTGSDSFGPSTKKGGRSIKPNKLRGKNPKSQPRGGGSRNGPVRSGGNPQGGNASGSGRPAGHRPGGPRPSGPHPGSPRRGGGGGGKRGR